MGEKDLKEPIDQKQKEIRKTIEAVFKAQRMIQEAMKDHLEVIEDLRASFEFLGEVFQELKEPVQNLRVPYDLPAFKRLMETRQKITKASEQISGAFKGLENVEEVNPDAGADLLNYMNALKDELIREKRKNQTLTKKLQVYKKKLREKAPKYIA